MQSIATNRGPGTPRSRSVRSAKHWKRASTDSCVVTFGANRRRVARFDQASHVDVIHSSHVVLDTRQSRRLTSCLVHVRIVCSGLASGDGNPKEKNSRWESARGRQRGEPCGRARAAGAMLVARGRPQRSRRGHVICTTCLAVTRQPDACDGRRDRGRRGRPAWLTRPVYG